MKPDNERAAAPERRRSPVAVGWVLVTAGLVALAGIVGMREAGRALSASRAGQMGSEQLFVVERDMAEYVSRVERFSAKKNWVPKSDAPSEPDATAAGQWLAGPAARRLAEANPGLQRVWDALAQENERVAEAVGRVQALHPGFDEGVLREFEKLVVEFDLWWERFEQALATGERDTATHAAGEMRTVSSDWSRAMTVPHLASREAANVDTRPVFGAKSALFHMDAYLTQVEDEARARRNDGIEGNDDSGLPTLAQLRELEEMAGPARERLVRGLEPLESAVADHAEMVRVVEEELRPAWSAMRDQFETGRKVAARTDANPAETLALAQWGLLAVAVVVCVVAALAALLGGRKPSGR